MLFDAASSAMLIAPYAGKCFCLQSACHFSMITAYIFDCLMPGLRLAATSLLISYRGASGYYSAIVSLLTCKRCYR